MKTAVALALALAMLWPFDGAHASMALAKEKNCIACHAVKVRLVGPSLEDIAQRYNSGRDQALVQRLADKIKKGGRGQWGNVPMPSNPHVSDEDALILAAWVLNLSDGNVSIKAATSGLDDPKVLGSGARP